jgi:hypothetical protein
MRTNRQVVPSLRGIVVAMGVAIELPSHKQLGRCSNLPNSWEE